MRFLKALVIFSLTIGCGWSWSGESGLRVIVGPNGLCEGDLLRHWRLEPQQQKAVLEYPAQVDWLHHEWVSRKSVVLEGFRNGKQHTWKLAAGALLPLTVPNSLDPKVLHEYQFARQLEGSGLYPFAAEVYDALAQASLARGFSDHACWFWSHAARVYARTETWQEAFVIYDLILEHAPNQLIEIDALISCGLLYMARRNHNGAAHTYKLAIARLKEIEAWPLTLARLEGMYAIALKRQGNLPSAEAHLAMALDLDRRHDARGVGYARRLHEMGEVQLRRGQPARARTFLEEAYQLRHGLLPGSYKESSSLVLLAMATRIEGAIQQAQAYNEQALALLRKNAPNSQHIVQPLVELGTIARTLGDSARAESYYRQALAHFQRVAPNHPGRADMFNNLGSLALGRSDLSNARDACLKALAIYEEQQPDSMGSSFALVNLGRIAFFQEHFQEAEAYLQKALNIRQKWAADGFDVSVVQIFLGDLYLETAPPKAEDFYQRALAIRKQILPGSLAFAEALAGLGKSKASTQQWVEAEALQRRALDILLDLTPKHRWVARSLYYLAIIQENTGRVAEALANHKRAIAIIEESLANLGGSQTARGRFSIVMAKHYLTPIKILVAQGRSGEAYDLFERYKSGLFLSFIAERPLTLEKIDPKLAQERQRLMIALAQLQERLESIGDENDPLQKQELQREYRLLHLERAALMDAVKRKAPGLRAIADSQVLNHEQIREALPPDTLLIAFLVHTEGTLVFTLSKDRPCEVTALPITGRVLQQKVADLGTFLAKPNQPIARSFLQDACADLYKTLFAPIKDRLKKRLLVVAGGPLHNLPFGLLRNSSASAKHLMEDHLIVRMSSASAYFALEKKSGDLGRGIAIFADPGGEEGAARQAEEVLANIEPSLAKLLLRTGQLGPLPFSSIEAEKIASLFPHEALVFKGEQASEETFMALDGHFRTLHFSCHSILDDLYPLDSGLVLHRGSDSHNGLLQAWEIIQGARVKSDMVVLSACDTALGESAGGAGVLGLTAAFHYAGTHTVLASLYKISDLSTALLMSRFYHHLKQGLESDEALQQAQLNLLHGADGKLAHPFYWAAFQHYGRPLALSKSF